MMSDRNDLPVPVGRGKRGGYPAGAVTRETFEWWRDRVESNHDSIIICAHHHMLRETTVGSGDWEGVIKKPDGSYEAPLPTVFKKTRASPSRALRIFTISTTSPRPWPSSAISKHIQGRSICGSEATRTTNPDDDFNDRTHIERKWGATFINCCALTRFHGSERSRPMSRLLTFTEGGAEVRVQCYLHTDTHAPQGWYPKAERVIQLGKPFTKA
jgi:hypothetical protein